MAKTPQSNVPPSRDGPAPHPSTTDHPQSDGPPPTTTQRPPVSTAGAGAPCCCKIVIWLDKITVDVPTDAGSLPGISKLLGLAPDDVYVRADDGAGGVVKYPSDGKTITLGRGQSAGDVLLATLRSDPADGCQIDRKVNIILRKSPKFNVILDRIRGIRTKIAALMKVIEQDQDAYVKLMALIPPNQAAAGTILMRILANQQEVDDLNAEVNGLLEELAGTANTLMDEFTVYVDRKVPCDDPGWIAALREPEGWKADAGDPNRARLTRPSEHLGGVWTVHLSALRICPQGNK